MSSRIKTVIKFSAFLLLTIFLMWFAFRKTDMKHLWEGIRAANYWWIVVGILFGVAAFFIRAQRWRYLIAPLGYNPKMGSVYNAVVIGYFANFLFPRLGEVARCGALNKSDDMPFDKLVGTVVVERVFDMICLLAIVVATFFLRINTFGKFIKENMISKLQNAHLLSLSTLLIVLFVFGLIVAAIWYFRERLSRISLVQKVWNFLKGIGDGLKAFVKMKHRAQFLIYSVLLWICYWVMAWIVLYSVPATAHLGPIDGLVVMVIGSFGIVAPTNGGLGAFHAITSIGLFVIYAVPEADGLLYATLAHGSQMLIIIILGLVAYTQLFLFAKKKKSTIA